MGQQESTYKKFDDKVRRRRRENNARKEAGKEQEEQEVTTTTTTTTSLITEKEKARAGSHFSLASLRWRPSLVSSTTTNIPSDGDLAAWPGWYHGWCSKSQVEKLLNCGPDGLFLVKNSTEFAGDLTLCISYKEAVLSYRIRQLQDNRRFTVDNDQSFDDVDTLVQYYKGEIGSLPCKLLLAAARQTNNEKHCSSETKQHSKYSAKRRKRNIDMEEILIVNREL